MAEQSARVIKVALISHGAGALFKIATGIMTGSAALISEALHSLLDTINQAVLYRDTTKETRGGSHVYAYGQGQFGYLINLWSGVGLFSIGCGLGLAWSLYALIQIAHGTPLVLDATPGWMALLAVVGALIIQGYSFALAGQRYLEKMRWDQAPDPLSYLRICKEINLSVIVVQCAAGLVGLMLALAGLLATAITHNPLWDALAALAIALLMGAVACYLGYLYLGYLTDVRDRPAEQALKELVAQRRAVHRCDRVRSLILDDHRTVLFADIELEQDTMVSGMLQRILKEKRALQGQVPVEKHEDKQVAGLLTSRASIEAALKRAELIVADLEQSIRERVPQVSEVSFRVRGLSPFALPKPVVRKPPPTREAEYVGDPPA